MKHRIAVIISLRNESQDLRRNRAIIVLLENRILERRVSDCMPSMMKIQTSSPSRTAERVKAFFEI